MPATKFICPGGNRVRIETCLKSCAHAERCMFLPTLKAISKSINRNLKEPTVTELISGIRETYLKKTTDYAVDPSSVLYAMQGQAVHHLHEQNSEDDILSEIRLMDDVTSGQFDLCGDLMDTGEGVLGDLKVTSSYKLMKALGIHAVRVDTGEVYKTGARKGQPKYRKELRYDGVRHLMDWALQLNYYRLLCEKAGIRVDKMYIQAICRDAGLRIAAERGIDQNIYIIPIHRISDHWLRLYFKTKADRLNRAIREKKMPPVCSSKERWQERKCLSYCAARENCPYAQALSSNMNQQAV